MRHVYGLAAALAALMWIGSVGCSPAPTPPKTAEQGEKDHGHGHDEHGDEELGPHGGHLVELGGDDFHAELVHAKDSDKVTVYLLNDKRTAPIFGDDATMQLNVKAAEGATQYELPAAPQTGDPEGKASRYEAENKGLAFVLNGEAGEVTVNISIGGTPYSGRMEHHDHDEHGHSHK